MDNIIDDFLFLIFVMFENLKFFQRGEIRNEKTSNLYYSFNLRFKVLIKKIGKDEINYPYMEDINLIFYVFEEILKSENFNVNNLIKNNEITMKPFEYFINSLNKILDNENLFENCENFERIINIFIKKGLILSDYYNFILGNDNLFNLENRNEINNDFFKISKKAYIIGLLIKSDDKFLDKLEENLSWSDIIPEYWEDVKIEINPKDMYFKQLKCMVIDHLKIFFS